MSERTIWSLRERIEVGDRSTLLDKYDSIEDSRCQTVHPLAWRTEWERSPVTQQVKVQDSRQQAEEEPQEAIDIRRAHLLAPSGGRSNDQT
jgi:hypothetical protein